MEFRDKVVIVTGASSGIGHDAALRFAERGAVVIGVARREERLRALREACRKHSPESGFIAGDLGLRDFAEGVIAEVVDRHGRIDVLVNNAAISKHKHVYHVSASEAERVMDVNFRSCLWMTLAAIPPMLERGEGSIVNVSSFAARVVPPREAIYAASKAAMNAFSEGLKLELEGSGLHVGLVIPGPIDTEIWEKGDEPFAYDGVKYPASVVTDAIFEVVEQRLDERMAPRRSAALLAARFLRLVFPKLLHLGMRRMDPVSNEILSRARERARKGLPLGGIDVGELEGKG
jgi:short-subunit dehydrogenase